MPRCRALSEAHIWDLPPQHTDVWVVVVFLFFFFIFFLKFYFIFKLNITVLDLPNIKMNPPQVS